MMRKLLLQLVTGPTTKCLDYFVFGSTHKANNDITCYRFYWSVLFTVVLWNVIFFGFSKTCIVKKSDDLQKKNVTLKKKKKKKNFKSFPQSPPETSEAPLSFLVTNNQPKFGWAFFVIFFLCTREQHHCYCIWIEIKWLWCIAML